MFTQENIPSTKAIVSSVASIAASAMLFRTLVNDLIPYELREYIFSSLLSVPTRFSSQQTIIIEELDDLSPNQIYEAANTYLGTKITPSTRRFKVRKPEQEKSISISIDKNEEIVDSFEGIELKWRLTSTTIQNGGSGFFGNFRNFSYGNSSPSSESRSLELSFHKKHKDKVMNFYLPHVLNEFESIKQNKKVVKLHTIDFNTGDMWASVNLDHPTTFDTIAMDPEMKKMVLEDLNKFKERKEFYKKVGKAWKRGYLLYGPPGTGKSSLIAAMANYLKFDIYDLDLTEIRCNSDLRRLLLGTANRSILVIEDIDCTVELEDRNKVKELHDPYANQLTLSGVLNFIDGLWSSCGEERLIVFTTNYKDRLDSALLRPGRMDIHILMSYCTPSILHTLAFNYLGKIHHHSLYKEIEELMKTIQVTPAEVAGELMKSDDVEISLQGFLEFLQNKKIEIDEKSNNDNKTEDGETIKTEAEQNKKDKSNKQVDVNC